MKNTSYDSATPSNTPTMMTRNHLTRAANLQQTSPHQQQNQSSTSVHHMQTKWSIKERLFLVSCVLINGESNWTFISEQLNKWMKYTSNYTNLPVNGGANTVSILGSNSINVPPVNIRTNNQCSKQYKFIVKSYALKYGINDLKKVYNHLAEERLKELKSLVVSSHQQYKDIYDEIEQILEMDTNNYEQLSEIWHTLKSAETNLNRSSYGTRSSSDQHTSLNKSSDLLSDEDAIKIESNIEKLNEIYRKKKEEQEAAAAARRAAELAAEAERLAAEEAARQQVLDTQQADQSMQVDTNLNQEQTEPSQQSEVVLVEIKQEHNESDKQHEFNKEDNNVEEANEDKMSSDEDMPKLNPKKKAKQNTESGIEWKPFIADEAASKNTDSASQAKSSNSMPNEDDSDIEMHVKRPRNTYGSPRKTLKVTESSSSSSDTESKTAEPVSSSEPTNIKLESPKPKVDEQPAAPTPVQQQQQQQQATRKSSRTRNSQSISSFKDTPQTTVTAASSKTDDSELIFTPLIKYDNKPRTDELPAQADASVSTKIEENDEIKSEATSEKDEKEFENDTDQSRSKRSKSRAKKDSEQVEETPPSEEITTSTPAPAGVAGENEEETEEPTTRASLRRQRNLANASLNTSVSNNTNNNNNKRRSSNVSKISKNLIVSVANTKINSRGLLSPKLTSSTAVNQDDQAAESTDLSGSSVTKDSGLLSIKCEPVQISNTSVINSSVDIDAAKQELDQAESSANTRSSRSKDLLNNAPFSSSSTSSNSSNVSLINKFEDEKTYRAWKKSILMVLNNIACHKHATVFMHPVKDDIAPGYSAVVYRPMDLGTLKKNIENGLIKSTKEFQRDIMLMFTNAIMYNSSSHDVHKISVEMYKEVLTDVEQLLNAQEAMGEEQKPLRFKDKRSSTASDRGTVIPGIELERNESNESNSEPVVNILMTTKKENFSKGGDEALETASLNSSSSVSQTLNKTNMNISSKEKFDSNLSCSTSVSTITSSSTTTNTKKRRPSSESSQTPKDSTKDQPKSKKRRKSGR